MVWPLQHPRHPGTPATRREVLGRAASAASTILMALALTFAFSGCTNGDATREAAMWQPDTGDRQATPQRPAQSRSEPAEPAERGQTVALALHAMAEAARHDDMAALADRIDPRTDAGRDARRILMGLAELDRLENALRQRAVARFGRDGLRLFAHPPTGAPRPLADMLEHTDKLEIDRTGDRATVRRADEPQLRPLQLTRIDGQWYLSPDELFEDIDDKMDTIEQYGRAMRKALPMIDVSPSPQAFQAQYRSILVEAMEEGEPASAP